MSIIDCDAVPFSISVPSLCLLPCNSSSWKSARVLHGEDGDAEKIPIRRGVEGRTHAVDHVEGGDRRPVGALGQIRHGPGDQVGILVGRDGDEGRYARDFTRQRARRVIGKVGVIVLHQVEAEGRGLASIAILPDEVDELGERHLTHAFEFRRSGVVGAGNLVVISHEINFC